MPNPPMLPLSAENFFRSFVHDCRPNVFRCAIAPAVHVCPVTQFSSAAAAYLSASLCATMNTGAITTAGVL